MGSAKEGFSNYLCQMKNHVEEYTQRGNMYLNNVLKDWKGVGRSGGLHSVTTLRICTITNVTFVHPRCCLVELVDDLRTNQSEMNYVRLGVRRCVAMDPIFASEDIGGCRSDVLQRSCERGPSGTERPGDRATLLTICEFVRSTVLQVGAT
ncbi:MAG: hypothetical protein HC767_06125 [Akkermansiaceae bacterium]|nr:hypothetical protein [Akkermansiaceae bacterium]